MKAKYFLFSSLFAIMLISVTFTSSNMKVKAEEKPVDQASSIQYYDENNNPIKPYSDEELKDMLTKPDNIAEQSSTDSDKAVSGEPSIQYYDENNNPIQPYSDEELKNMLTKPNTSSKNNLVQSTVAVAGNTYSFDKTTFSSYVWLNRGAGFLNPVSFDAEPATRIQKMELEAYGAASGTYYGKAVFENTGYWISCNWEHLHRSRSYKFKLVNKGSSAVTLKYGNLRYN